jgi:predicted small integral membrane protein
LTALGRDHEAARWPQPGACRAASPVLAGAEGPRQGRGARLWMCLVSEIYTLVIDLALYVQHDWRCAVAQSMMAVVTVFHVLDMTR